MEGRTKKVIRTKGCWRRKEDWGVETNCKTGIRGMVCKILRAIGEIETQ